MVTTLRKFLAALLAAAMVLSVSVPVFAALYGDTQGHWAENYINKWSDNGILVGSDGLFRPDSNMTYAEFATIFSKLMGYSAKASNTFSDVADSAWYADAMLQLVAAGILVPKGDRLTPDAALTRADEFIMLAKAFGLEPVSGNTSFLDDSAIPANAKGYIKALAEKGVLTGYPVSGGYEVRASGNITRAELLTTFDKMAPNLISTAGTYSSDYMGTLVINKADTKLSDSEVRGDLYLAQGIGSGDVHLSDVAVTGATHIYGGGVNSIYLNNFKSGTIVINKSGGELSLKTEGSFEVDTIVVLSGCSLNLPDDWKGAVILQKDADTGKPVVIGGGANTVTSYAKGAIITVNGKVNTVDLYEQASLNGTGRIETVNQTQGDRSSIAGSLSVIKKNITVSGGGSSSGGSGSSGGSSQQAPQIIMNQVNVTYPYNFEVIMNNYGEVQFTLSGNDYEGTITAGEYTAGTYPLTSSDYLTPGSYTLTVSRSGYRSASISFVVPLYYKVSYDVNGGVGEIDDEYWLAEGGGFLVRGSSGISREHYDFTFWISEKDNRYESGQLYPPINRDLTLYAQWEKTEYTVTYDTNGATGTAPADTNTYYVGDSATITGKGDMVNNDKYFLGWSTTETGAVAYTPGEEIEITESLRLYAVWGDSGLTVVYDPNGADRGDCPADGHPEGYDAGDTVTVLGNTGTSPLVKAGYAFLGWNTKADGTGTGHLPEATFVITESASLYAVWGEIKVTVDPREPQTTINNGDNEARYTVKTENFTSDTASKLELSWEDGNGTTLANEPSGAVIKENKFSKDSGSLIITSQLDTTFFFRVVIEGIQSDLVTLTFRKPSSGEYTVSGTVKVDGVGVKGIRIFFTEASGITYSTLSKENGAYTISIPVGTYTYTLHDSTAEENSYVPAQGSEFKVVVVDAAVSHDIQAAKVKAPSISLNTATFAKGTPEDVTFAVDLGVGDLKATGIASVNAGDTALATEAEWSYDVNATNLIIEKAYLETQAIGELELTVVFNDADETEATLKITISTT